MDRALASAVDLTTSSANDQLLWGFQDSQPGQGRWTTGSFEVSLQRPAFNRPNGAAIDMRFRIPDDQIRAAGPLILTAYVSGRKMPSMRITQSGTFVYAATVRPADLYWEVTPVVFQFEREALATESLSRRHLALISNIGLVTP